MFRKAVRLARERLGMRTSSVSRTPLPTHHRGCHLLWREEAEGASPSHATSCSCPGSVGLAGSPGARACECMRPRVCPAPGSSHFLARAACAKGRQMGFQKPAV